MTVPLQSHVSRELPAQTLPEETDSPARGAVLFDGKAADGDVVGAISAAAAPEGDVVGAISVELALEGASELGVTVAFGEGREAGSIVKLYVCCPRQGKEPGSETAPPLTTVVQVPPLHKSTGSDSATVTEPPTGTKAVLSSPSKLMVSPLRVRENLVTSIGTFPMFVMVYV